MTTATLHPMRDMRGPDDTAKAKRTAATAAWPTFLAGCALLAIGAATGILGLITLGLITGVVGVILLAATGKVFPR